MEDKKYLQLNSIGAYTIAFHLSNYIWNIVVDWDRFAKNTVGEQFVTAMDSVSANIAEGFGRYGKKDKIRFYRFSSGSLKECHDWAAKSVRRKLTSEEQYNHIFQKLEMLPLKINSLIKFTNDKLQY